MMASSVCESVLFPTWTPWSVPMNCSTVLRLSLKGKSFCLEAPVWNQLSELRYVQL